MCASARVGERFVAPGRCLELGPLAALNCGRLATWSRKNRAAGDRDFCVNGEVEGRRRAEHHTKERVAQLHLARRGRRRADGERSMLWTSTSHAGTGPRFELMFEKDRDQAAYM